MLPSEQLLRRRSGRLGMSGVRWFAAACLLAFAWLLMATVDARAADRLAQPGALSYNLRLFGSEEDRQRQLSSIAQSADSVRVPIRWDTVESSKGSFQWSWADDLVRQTAKAGLRAQVILAYSAPWAQSVPGHDSSPPKSNADFARYAAALADRYGANGDFWQANPSVPYLPVLEWEVWNEQNSPAFWYSKPDPRAYARLYLESRAAVKQEDPSARVITGGLAWKDAAPFVAGMYQEPGMKGSVDGVGLHPYGLTVDSSLNQLRPVREAIDAADGPGVPIDVTEFGWPTGKHGEAPNATSQAWVDESTRAAFLERLTSELVRSDCNVRIVSVYSSQTSESKPGDPEDWFGIYNLDGTPKPSALAYNRALRQLAGHEPGPTGRVTVCYPAPPAPPPPAEPAVAAPPPAAPPAPRPRRADWRQKTCRLLNTTARKRAFRAFHRRYCAGPRARARRTALRRASLVTDWRTKTCRVIRTRAQKRALRAFHRRWCAPSRARRA